ncbi:YheT family hydrolase [Nitrospirillum sp. BR 11163]|uniref:YheT family hydrolase n=1 Tax=Nitrospirillum sp. BR 11163 TaxID=3104323 RepID=UPI002AFFAC7B|nr:alpha/beta fold hydrolase [Nitrospirillum sp. BR 11163]MEA1676308.1 alpha/beta fold hydrolase [Nitrospirillum sp. BR 11163]
MGADLQTLRNTVRRPWHALPPGESLVFPMGDGTGDSLAGTLHHPAAPAGGRPLVVLIHGLAGSEDSPYIRAAAGAVLARGHAALRLNLRGAGPFIGRTRQRYHAGRTGDARAVLAHLAATRPELTAAGVVVVGYSLAGNMVLKLMGEVASLPPLVRGGVAVSAPIDLSATSRRFLKARNRPYHLWLLRQMKAETLATPAEPGSAEAERQATVRRARTIYDFDDGYVAPANGWRGAEDYYRVNSALQFLPAITRPTLVVHALDDPWIAPEPYLAFDWAAHPALVPLIVTKGGHVGFHAARTGQGAILGGGWLDRCLVRFLETLA